MTLRAFVKSRPILLRLAQSLRRIAIALRQPRRSLLTLSYRCRLAHCGRHVDFSTTVILRNPRNISIGDRCSFSNYVICDGHDRITIGNDCMFANGVMISTATHDYRVDPMNSRMVTSPVTIGDNVWCGVGSIIMPGVRVGDGAVIGAGALILRDVPDNAIMGGVPARVIGHRPGPLASKDPAE